MDMWIIWVVAVLALALIGLMLYALKVLRQVNRRHRKDDFELYAQLHELAEEAMDEDRTPVRKYPRDDLNPDVRLHQLAEEVMEDDDDLYIVRLETVPIIKQSGKSIVDIIEQIDARLCFELAARNYSEVEPSEELMSYDYGPAVLRETQYLMLTADPFQMMRYQSFVEELFYKCRDVLTPSQAPAVSELPAQPVTPKRRGTFRFAWTNLVGNSGAYIARNAQGGLMLRMENASAVVVLGIIWHDILCQARVIAYSKKQLPIPM